MSNFSTKLETAVRGGIPFVLVRIPEENDVLLYTNDASGINKVLLHSFDSKKETVISDNNPVSISQRDFNYSFELKLAPSTDYNPVNHTDYEQLIQTAIDKINHSEIRKIVISRINLIENKNYNLFKTFSELMKQHPAALVYLWHDPNGETWLGATPELLLSQRNKELKTVSLAGTKTPEAEWTAKEIEEQQIVTDYITEAMKSLDELETEEVQTIQAGKFQHLKTKISAVANSGFDLADLLKKLHPTPAVCGLPKKASFDFILENENYDRGFYTGYIGIETGASKTYFVNLRSARFFKNSIFVYAGGGITADSVPAKEWAETVIKSGTIINALTE